MKLTIGFLFLVLVGCSSTKLVSTWKSPETGRFDAYKVLVVGVAQDKKVRTGFESELVQKLRKKGIETIRSIDLLEVAFTASKKSEEDLNKVEQLLLDRGFDAILFTKIVGVESKKTFRERVNRVNTLFNTFSRDYLEHQNLYNSPEPFEAFTVYHVETSLYCICPGKARELLWKGNFEVTQSKNLKKIIAAYSKRLLNAMEEQEVLF